MTHRIVGVVNEDTVVKYQTKGDANDSIDKNLSKKSDVIGKVVFKVSYLGYLLSFAQTPKGLVIMIIIPASILIYVEINKIQKEIKKKIDYRKRVKNKRKSFNDSSKSDNNAISGSNNSKNSNDKNKKVLDK